MQFMKIIKRKPNLIPDFGVFIVLGMVADT